MKSTKIPCAGYENISEKQILWKHRTYPKSLFWIFPHFDTILSSIWFGINLELFILNREVIGLIYDVFQPQKIVCILVSKHSRVAFHLGLPCLPKNPVRVFCMNIFKLLGNISLTCFGQVQPFAVMVAMTWTVHQEKQYCCQLEITH